MLRRLIIVSSNPFTYNAWFGCRIQRQTLHACTLSLAPSDVKKELANDLYKIIHNDRVVIFMTGTPDEPRCRFTVHLIELINQLGLEYVYFNILQDNEVCEGLKKYSDWPTYPQVYIDGVLLGGYDVVKEMMLDGSLVKLLNEKNLL